MTEDKKKNLEMCFENVEKLVNLRRSLDKSLETVNHALRMSMEEMDLFDPPEGDARLEEERLDTSEEIVLYIKSHFDHALWETVQNVLPHYKTNK
ncbi:uncharacterized protein METZ01_LOCUS469182 [marine metagenome]|uniref:Uncharacterized protein n=1 Tax=marine metagenome TaxID=408172 RepID=A0A383BA79_9ZZZZ